MNVVIEQGIIAGTVIAPPSKSITQRAYAAALLHNGTTIIRNGGASADEQAALLIIQQLGATVTGRQDNSITFESAGVHPVSNEINCGESGLAARLFTPIAALGKDMLTITGTGSLLKRPMDGFGDTLPKLGIKLDGFTGYLPVNLKGPLNPRALKVNGSGGSQLISGLLFALTHAAHEPVTLSVTGLNSKPYIDLTLEMLARCGRPVKNIFYREFIIDPALFATPDVLEINVAADWSSGAFFLVAGAIAGNVTVQNLPLDSRQADKAILEVLQAVGALLSITDHRISVKAANLMPFDFDATHCPDLFPILAILASCCNGESSIKGVHRLFHKESNRVESIAEMLFDFAIPFSVEDDTLYVTGVQYLQGTVIDSYDDHRIVMAAAIGALRARGPVNITDPEVVNKSYPRFFDDLASCGARCTFTGEP